MAGRKEYELLFKLTAALGGNFNAAFSSALNTTRQMQNSLQKLNSITGKIDAYKKQEAALESNRQKLERLTAEHERLQREISETGEPTEELRAKMAQNERQIAATTSRIEQQEARLNELGGELSDAGVNTSRLTEENERLSKSYERVKKSQEELAKVNAALEQNNAAISKTKTQLAGTVGTLAALGTAIYAGPVRKAAEFEAQMSTVEAISGATADEMKRLSDEAKRMGATTQFTAVEAGKALEYMAMAGWKTDQMLGGLPGIMNLAAASGEDLGQVSDIVTDALTAFNMTADQAGRFADVLAQASSNSNTNVAMMGATFQKVAPVAGALGYSVEDVSLAIGLMANASIKSEVAGTSLKTALANMAKPTKQMKEYMDKYGISLTNADGSMKSFREVVDNLRSRLGGLSETEQVAAATAIFGKESFAGMLAIVNASEADFQKLSDSVNNSAGAAERMAQIKLDNFQGKVTLLQSAVEGLQIALGDALLPTFTEGAEKAAELISKLTEFINANPELVRTITKVVTGLLAFKAAGLVAKLAFLDLKGGVLTIQKVMALFKGKFALAGVEAVGFASKVKGCKKRHRVFRRNRKRGGRRRPRVRTDVRRNENRKPVFRYRRSRGRRVYPHVFQRGRRCYAGVYRSSGNHYRNIGAGRGRSCGRSAWKDWKRGCKGVRKAVNPVRPASKAGRRNLGAVQRHSWESASRRGCDHPDYFGGANPAGQSGQGARGHPKRVRGRGR